MHLIRKNFAHGSRVKLVLALALAGLVIGSVAYGAIPSSDGTINACHAKVAGVRYLRLIDTQAGETCKSSEQKLSWNQQGPKGEPGPSAGFPDTLPSGKTVRGAYSAFGDTLAADGLSSFASDSISFGIVLPAAPTAHLVRVGGPADPACSGTAAAPQAAPGHLCIYEADTRNGEVFFDDPLTGATGAAVRAFGAEVGVRANLADGDFGSRGSWAVTAP